MTSYILLVAAVILLCLSLNKMSNKLGIPMLLAYILLGMMFGTDGILKIPFDNFTIAEQICTVSLIFIMFYGGFGTNWKQDVYKRQHQDSKYRNRPCHKC